MTRLLAVILPAVAAVALLAYGINCIFDVRQYRELERQARQLQRGIEHAEKSPNDREAVNRYEALVPHTPEVNLRILQRQWAISLDLLKQTSIARYNTSLEGDLSRLFNELNQHLGAMQKRCNLILEESESLPAAIAWRVYNLRGAVRLLKCFVLLETEKTWEKAAATMKEAISDLKSSIDAVDQIRAATYEKNIPRWNLELLHAEEQIRRIQFAKVEEQERLNLKDNLEAIIPEKGGYAPGEPLETRVLK